MKKRIMIISAVISLSFVFFIACQNNGEPENIILAEGKVYLQVNIHLEFSGEGYFLGQSFKAGDTYDFRCTDFYELDEDGMIIYGQVYVKPPHSTN